MSAPVEFKKIVVEEGKGSTKPVGGDSVTIDYTGWLYDPSKTDGHGSL
jgi:FKBP-type peptidyl-prolyl cis-trans isomerase